MICRTQVSLNPVPLHGAEWNIGIGTSLSRRSILTGRSPDQPVRFLRVSIFKLACISLYWKDGIKIVPEKEQFLLGFHCRHHQFYPSWKRANCHFFTHINVPSTCMSKSRQVRATSHPPTKRGPYPRSVSSLFLAISVPLPHICQDPGVCAGQGAIQLFWCLLSFSQAPHSWRRRSPHSSHMPETAESDHQT